MMRQYFRFLDELRESGETNMFGAPSYLRATFGLTKQEALDATSAWMKTSVTGPRPWTSVWSWPRLQAELSQTVQAARLELLKIAVLTSHKSGNSFPTLHA